VPALPPADAARLEQSGFGFAAPGTGLDWDSWIDQARTSANPEVRAQYDALVELAGGRTDNVAIKQVMSRYLELQRAETASERDAALRGWADQIGTAVQANPALGNLATATTQALADVGSNPALQGTDWGPSLSAALATPRLAAAFAQGVGQGVFAGAKDMVVGVAMLAGQLVQYGADNSVLGNAGDLVRGVTGALPGWADSILPSAARGQASNEALRAMGANVGQYLSQVAADPGKLRADVIAAIDGAWDSLKGSHAAAAAQGSEAEARWWGETVGRITFEVGATLVPVTKLGLAGKIADAAGDLGRAAGGVVDLSRISSLVQSGTRLARQVLLGGNADEAAQALAALNRIDTAALPADQARAIGNMREGLSEALEIAAPRNGTLGNPAAIYSGFGELNARQTRLLEMLPGDGARITIPRGDISINDIAALTARTNEEFAIFTNGSRRMVLRGNEGRIVIPADLLRQLQSEGWRWSAHTQPGIEPFQRVASASDQNVLRALGQEQSVILNSRGDRNVFTQNDISLLQIDR
jgi:hypothetical protein